MNYKDKFKAQMKKAGINSLDDLKSDAEKKAFFKAVDKSHTAKNESVTEELLSIAEESINEMKEGGKGSGPQMKPGAGTRAGSAKDGGQTDDEADEYDSQMEMMKEMMKKMDEYGSMNAMKEEMKTGDDDMTPDALKLNAMVKDPHKSSEENPKKDLNAKYMKSDVRADVKNGGGADMSKVQDAPKMMAAMKKINSLRYMEPGSGEFYKIKNWVDTFMRIPFGKHEGLPISIMEAMSFGLPILATDVGACNELVNSATGLLMPADVKPNQIADCIMALLPKSQSADFRQGVRRYWEQHFNLQTNHLQFIQSINELN